MKEPELYEHLKPFTPTVLIFGPIADHDMPCPVLHGYKDETFCEPSKEKAVLDMSTGVFKPSRKAQQEGWRLIKLPNSSWKRKLITWLLKG